MLKPETREKLQSLIQHPDFTYISVDIRDKKMIHTMDGGRPTFYTDVDIHADGDFSISLVLELMPEIKLNLRQSNKVEHSDHVSIGEYARGTLEGADVSFWSTFYTMPIEKAPVTAGADAENREEIIQPEYNTEWPALEDQGESLPLTGREAYLEFHESRDDLGGF